MTQKLSEITLGQYIDFYNQWGREHNSRWAGIQAMQDGDERNDKYTEYDVDVALQTHSFYTGIPFEELYKDVVVIYSKQNEIFASQVIEESSLEYKGVFDWNGEKWAIQPLFGYTPKMTHEQFEISQDVALIYSDFMDGVIESLLYLCASYFRKVGEKYSSDFGSLGNERAELMRQLPLSHALRVKKYMVESLAAYNSMSK